MASNMDREMILADFQALGQLWGSSLGSGGCQGGHKTHHAS